MALSSSIRIVFFFFNDTATTEIYTLSLHDALPISIELSSRSPPPTLGSTDCKREAPMTPPSAAIVEAMTNTARSEEHTSELQSRQYLVCRLLLEKKKKKEYIKHR